MDRDTQFDILDRIHAHRAAGATTDLTNDGASYREPVSNYTDAARAESEEADLFRRQPIVAALTGDLPNPGDYITLDVVGVPVVVIRQKDGTAKAFRNVCRHRGSCVAEGRGSTRLLACPYHNWSYGLDGKLVAISSRTGFTDVDKDDMGLSPIACDEAGGLVFIRLEGDEPLVAAEFLAGLLDDFGPLAFDTWVPVEVRLSERDMNWKLMVDTFVEVYHVQTLHAETIAPLIMSNNALFDAFGPHGRCSFGRWSVEDQDTQPRDEWELLPHVTFAYLLVPNTVLLYQQDHIELWQIFPDGPNQCHATVTLYAPEAPATEKAANYWKKNIDLLMQVTETEDFITMEQIQRSFRSGAQEAITFGANEPGLVHFHRSLDALLAGEPGLAPSAGQTTGGMAAGG